MLNVYKYYNKFSHSSFSRETQLSKSLRLNFGWGGRIRTYGTRDQNPMPYHLATPQCLMEIHYLKFIFKCFRTTNSVHTIIFFFPTPNKIFICKIIRNR